MATKPRKPRVPRAPSVEEQVLQRLIDGESLAQICRSKGMPNRGTVLRWMNSDGDFATRCAHARVIQADVLFERMAEIEEGTLDTTIDPAAARAVLSSMQWRAAKLAPRKYAELKFIDAKVDMSDSLIKQLAGG